MNHQDMPHRSCKASHRLPQEMPVCFVTLSLYNHTHLCVFYTLTLCILARFLCFLVQTFQHQPAFFSSALFHLLPGRLCANTIIRQRNGAI